MTKPVTSAAAAGTSTAAEADVTPSLQGVVFGPFELNLLAQRLTRDGQPVALRPRYFDVLVFLAATGGRLVSKEELLDAVWGHRHVSDSVLKVAVNALRTALCEDAKAPRYLQTVARRGYRFLGARFVAPAHAGQRVDADAYPASASTARPDESGAALAAPMGNLPSPLSDLVGRELDLRQLLSALAAHRLVTLHGPAGAGKTRLALAAAHLQQHQQPVRDGVWLLRLDTLTDGTLLLPTVARTLGLGAGADADLPTLARALAPLQLLLVLDSVEHIAAAVTALAAALLAQAPGVRLLVTSQLPLRLVAEQVQPLGPLELPALGDDGADSAAVQLLTLRARQRQPGLLWDAEAAAHAGSICRLLDGLPLALELAAARVPLLGWAGVHARLGERLSLLTSGDRGAPQRQRTLRAALAWSCALLQPHEWRLLQHLSVFAGSFTLQGAGTVAGISDELELLDTLDGLLEHALLSVAETTPSLRWRLFDSVRSYAAEALRDQGLQEQALHNLLQHQSALYERADRELATVYLLPWLRSLQPEVDNLRGALTAALPIPALQEQTLRLFCASAQYRSRSGWVRELRRDHAVISGWPQQDWNPVQQAAYDLALGHLSANAQLLPPALGLASVRRAQQVFEHAADTWSLYTALNLEAGLLLRLGAPHEERSTTVARMQALHGPDWGPAERRQGAWQAVQLQRQRGDDVAYEAAATTYLATARALGDTHGTWVAAQVLAQIAAAHDQFEQAMLLLERTASEMRAEGQLRQNTAVLAQWALLRLTRSADAATLALLHEALQALTAEGKLWWLADALAWVPAQRGEWPTAIRLQAWADALVQQRGEKRGPLFEAVRRHWDTLLNQQAQAPVFRASWPAHSGLDESSALGLVFGAAWGGGAAADDAQTQTHAQAQASTAAAAWLDRAPQAQRHRAAHG